MIARELVNYMIPPLKPGDDIGKAKLWMDEMRLTQLPVIDDQKFIGIITDEMLFDEDFPFVQVEEYPLLGADCKVGAGSHYYDVLRLASEQDLKLVAVEDEFEAYIGVITKEDILEAFAQSSWVIAPGAILTLKLKSIDYSLSEISRLVESNDARILTSHISELPGDPNQIVLTIKLNVEEVNRIIASLDNNGFVVSSSYNTADAHFDERERLDIFMKYLKI